MFSSFDIPTSYKRLSLFYLEEDFYWDFIHYGPQCSSVLIWLIDNSTTEIALPILEGVGNGLATEREQALECGAF
jgi:hypothetical protein